MYMRCSLFIFLAFFVTSGSYGQLMLKNTTTDKIKTLKAGGDIQLTVNLNRQGVDFGQRVIHGKLDTVESRLIKVLPEEEVQIMVLDNGLKKVTTTEYANLKGLKPLSVEISGLDEIAYRGKNGLKWDGIGSLLTTLGGLSALVVAPLASIDYSDGSFNQDLYYQWAGYSLAATGAGVAILLANKKKQYAIQQNNQPASTKSWKVLIK